MIKFQDHTSIGKMKLKMFLASAYLCDCYLFEHDHEPSASNSSSSSRHPSAPETVDCAAVALGMPLPASRAGAAVPVQAQWGKVVPVVPAAHAVGLSGVRQLMQLVSVGSGS